VEKIFSFLSTRSYTEKIFCLNAWFTTTFERHKRFIWGLDHIFVTFCHLTSTETINAFNHWVTVRLWQKDICDMPKSTKYSGITLKYFLSYYDLIIIFCQLGWQVAQLFPPLVVGEFRSGFCMEEWVSFVTYFYIENTPICQMSVTAYCHSQ
jgi:hypothetical protein